MFAQRSRKGFTLAEMLVTVSIVAVLAAVVVPSISGSLFKGDAGRVTSDLLSVRGGIEQFLADVRKYPGKPTDLSAVISATGTDLNAAGAGAAYGAAVVGRWRGPYLNSALGQTGFGGTFGSTFMKVDCSTTTTTITTPCLAVTVTGIAPAEAKRIDFAMDDSVATTGSVRFKTTGTDTLFYLAMPIQ